MINEEYSTISNDRLTYFMDKIYNKWFRKWRDKTCEMSEIEWQMLIEEAVAIGEEGREHSIIIELIYALETELEERQRKIRNKNRNEEV